MSNNISRKYSGKLGDSSALDAKLKKDREARAASQSLGDGKASGDGEYPFELVGGFHNVLNEAKGLVKKVEAGGRKSGQHGDEGAGKGETDAEGAEGAAQPVLLSQGFRRWAARLALLAAIAFLSRSIFIELTAKDSPKAECEDILVPVEQAAPNYESVKDYVKYVVSKFSSGGMEGIDGKWIEGIPPYFKERGKAKLELLGAGFSIGKLCADKTVVYVVECHPDINPGKTIFVEVVKGKLPSGAAVFRLQKVY